MRKREKVRVRVGILMFKIIMCPKGAHITVTQLQQNQICHTFCDHLWTADGGIC